MTDDYENMDEDSETQTSGKRNLQAATVRGREWLRHIFNPNSIDHRPVLERIEQMPRVSAAVMKSRRKR